MDQTGEEKRDRSWGEAEALFASDDLPALLELAVARLAQWPGDLPARMWLCRVRIRQGELAEAREILQGIGAELKSLGALHFPFAELCLTRGLPEEAADHYEQFIRLNPGTPDAFAAAERLQEIGSRDDAAARTGEAPEAAGAEEVPLDFQTVTLAELYIRQGHLAQAAELLEAILRRDPQQPGAAEKLREVRQRLQPAEESSPAAVAAELARWLQNVDRLRPHHAA